MPRPRARFNVVNPVFSERQVGGSDSELSEPDAAGAAAPRLVRDAPG
jgi:hypothetical protein